jgi:carbon storage regulator
MLVLSRKANETIIIDGDIRVTVVSIRGNQVRIGIEAPPHVGILRQELQDLGADAPQPDSPRRRLAPARRAMQNVG